MEEIKLTPEELKDAIDFGKLIGSGFFSKVFKYNGRLIKLDKDLYNYLRNNVPELSKEFVERRYNWDQEDFNDRDQLEELEKRQPFIRPRVPEGIITLKGVNSKIDGISPGIIVPNFTGYENISKIPKNDYLRILMMLKTIFNDLKNLADNEISQEDITGGNFQSDPNILVKGDDAQLIDMSGEFVNVGSTFTNPNEMYREFAKLIYKYYNANGLVSPYPINEIITEDKVAEMITEFEKQTKSK